ncbi:hypothetical protein SRABI27_02188 [Pedobacter sp. Bi27]|uniref:hypothetical protein n=1 Tax=unclassified Pedobacter TaxID=2628915 RepID=UPI001DA09C55|nr:MULTISPECIES: hypothetical protein [unclassified Pedobacter]CAH0219282.1 hypothetical protein SRABI27_02188 [Pedobacter sp. Bi27]CAH0232643.1 hypothetical protein SRABI36_02760 [Pedobacter sp. Bi36]CAH0259418.1 hypothetical protein SRABI126_03160 [Pedobacter sp. Bi126]
MKNNILIYIAIFLLALSACKKDDYKRDGGPSNAYVDMTTYDYLKSNRNFDSLVKVIDKAGLKDAVNGDITLFATTNYGIADYVKAKKYQKSLQTGNENFDFGIKDLPSQELSDSLKTYLFTGKINRDQITLGGKLYNSLLGAIPNVQYLIKFRRSFEYSQYLNYVDYVTYTKVIGTRDDKEPDLNAIPDDQKDKGVDVQTSGIITRTGIIHVLNGNHRLFFNGQSLGN